MKIILLIACLSSLVLSLFAEDKEKKDKDITWTPYADFKEYQEKIAFTKSAEGMYPFITAAKVKALKALDRQARINNWITEKKLLRSFNVIDDEPKDLFKNVKTEMNGRHAFMEITGYDAQLKDDSVWNVIMIYEDKRWRFSERTINEKSEIDNDIRTWVIGRDEVEVEAMLKAHDKKSIQLLIADTGRVKAEDGIVAQMKELNIIEFPLSELSKDDIDYLNQRLAAKEQNFQKTKKSNSFNVLLIRN